jgi:hypothetical protein
MFYSPLACQHRFDALNEPQQTAKEKMAKKTRCTSSSPKINKKLTQFGTKHSNICALKKRKNSAFLTATIVLKLCDFDIHIQPYCTLCGFHTYVKKRYKS